MFIFLGTLLVGRRDRRAFIFTAIGELFWFIHAARLGMLDLAVICALFGLMALLNYYKWGKTASGNQRDKRYSELLHKPTLTTEELDELRGWCRAPYLTEPGK